MINIETFARYLPASPHTRAWGVAVTGAGAQVVEPGESYPPAGHPSDHAFRWEDGRVLGALQLVLIRSGLGVFESSRVVQQQIGPGDVLILPPQAWHRYAPDPQSGWSELWIELEGPVVATLAEAGILGGEARTVRLGRPADLQLVLEEIHQRLGGVDGSSHDPVRGALGLQALALVLDPPSPAGVVPAASLGWVREAERILSQNLGAIVPMEDLARRLGVSYTQFRREFRRVTGLAPYTYVTRLRLAQARRMVGSDWGTLGEIAERLGFSSAFHLSAAFKKEYGQSPRDWRKVLDRKA